MRRPLWLGLVAASLIFAGVAVAHRADIPLGGPFGASGPPKGGLENEEEVRQMQARLYVDSHSDRNGNARPDLWRRGVTEFKQLRSSRWSGSSPEQPNAVTPPKWTLIGPAPLRIDADQIFQGSGPDAGMVTDIAISPAGTSDMVVYISENDGGVWKTTNGGTSWSPLTDSMPSNSIGALALDPSNPSIVYAGTGNPDHNGFIKAVGIYRSSDGGEHWEQRGANVLSDRAIFRMVSPASNVLLVGTDAGLFKSVDGGVNFGNNAPSFNNGSPVIGGSNCSTDVSGTPQCITDLKVDTASSNTIYAGVWGKGVYRSTDSGTSFPTNLFSNAGAPAAPFSRISIAQSILPNNQTLLVTVATDYGSASPTYKGLYKSTTGGTSWARMGAADTPAADPNYDGVNDAPCQCNYDLIVAVDPQDANRVYLGFQELWVSTNGGTNFGATPPGRNVVHWDTHAIAFSPQTHWGPAPTRFWLGHDGGIATSANGGSTWSNLNEGIATQLFRDIDIGRGSAVNRQYTYGGTQDTGTIEDRPAFPANDWHLGIDGDGTRVAVDPSDPQRAYGLDNGCYMYTDNAGATWNFGGPQFCTNGYAYALAIDPKATANVYKTDVFQNAQGTYANYPGSNLYRSTDSGVSYSSMHSFGSQIWSVSATKAGAGTSAEVLWVSLQNGTVARTANASQGASSTWSVNAVPGAPANPNTWNRSAIAGDPTDANTAVVVYAGFCGNSCAPGNRTKHVFRTTNAGTTWTDISGTDGGTQNLPDLPLHSVAIDSTTTPHTIIVASDAGVSASQDNGATWQVLGTGLPTAEVTSVDIDDSHNPPIVRAGTYGRSAWELTPSPEPANIVFQRSDGNDTEIWIRDDDGTETQLTNNTANDEDPVYAPDRTKIAFTSSRDGNQEIYTMSIDGTNPVRLTNNATIDARPTWSPNSTQIAFTAQRDGNNEIYKMNADGTSQTRLTNNTASDRRPAWSPDGSKIAFTTNRNDANPGTCNPCNFDIYTMDTSGGNLFQVTLNVNNDENPAWSPDSTKIVYDSNRVDGVNYEIFVANANGTGNVTRLTDNTGKDEWPSWSPDGTQIVFDSDRDGNLDLYKVRADGTTPAIAVTSALTDESEPKWKPKPVTPTAVGVAGFRATRRPGPSA